MADLPKAIHIELSNEGGKVAVFEIDREYLFSEAADVVDAEGISCAGPTDDLSIAPVLNSAIYTSIIS